MTIHFTNTEIAALGERLRPGITDMDRTIYGSYRRVLNQLRFDLETELQALFPNTQAGSRTKRVETVAAKLQRRPDLALSQVTDLAGCRIIVSGRVEQQAAVTRLQAIYDVQQVDDKGDSPKFGYRAVYLDIRYRGQLMEIQVQTRNQHLWQMVSELAAGYDIFIKYGGGRQEVSRALQDLSELARRCDLEGTELTKTDIDQAQDVIISAYSG